MPPRTYITPAAANTNRRRADNTLLSIALIVLSAAYDVGAVGKAILAGIVNYGKSPYTDHSSPAALHVVLGALAGQLVAVTLLLLFKYRTQALIVGLGAAPLALVALGIVLLDVWVHSHG